MVFHKMFTSFHSRIYLDVEPVSVSPFSTGCLSRGLGPSMVSFLRNANNSSESQKEFFKALREENKILVKSFMEEWHRA